MDEAWVIEAYDRLLASIGDRADDVGDRPVVTPWLHVGSAYRGPAIVGASHRGHGRAAYARNIVDAVVGAEHTG
jgi:hypothetical protein